MERDLTEFELNVLKFVTTDVAGKEKIGIAASLPKVFYNKMDSDTWEDRERELGRTSEFVGELHSRNTFTSSYMYPVPTTVYALMRRLIRHQKF